MHRSSHPLRPLAVPLFVLASALAFAQAPPAVADKQAFDRNLQSQIATIYREKASRSPALRKMSMDLVYAVRMAKGQDVTKGLPKLEVPVVVLKDGTVDVEFHAAVTSGLLGQLRSVGAQIRSAHVRFSSINARIPVRSLETAAMFPGVRAVSTLGKFTTNSGNYQSQGDRSIRGNALRDNYGLTGAGVKVGIISDSNDHQEASQTSGDLPATIDVPGGNNGRPATGEGTAMMEIVHDVAPGAALAYNTAWSTQADFAQHYLDLFNAGCKVIADDVQYYAEPAFQDGPIAAAMNQIFYDGGICFAAAGNSGSLRSNTASVWEGDFADSGYTWTYGDGTVAKVHGWAAGQPSNKITSVGTGSLTLQWNDPWGAATNDYDFFLTDSAGNVVVAADAFNAGGNPIEDVYNGTPNRFAYVVQYSGANRVVRLNQSRGKLQFGTNGQIYGHPAASNGYGIAAINAAMSPTRAFTTGDVTTSYSSDGPRRVYFDEDGGLIATNLTFAGAKIRSMPALTGPDGVSTNTPGFATFYGTSAASPHVAALTALLKEFDPEASPLRLLIALTVGAVDVGTTNYDVNSGSGAINGLGSIKFLQETSGSTVKPTSVTVSPTSLAALTIDLGLAAPPNGINVVVTGSGDAGRFVYPASFVVNGGSKTRTFLISGGGPGYGAATATLTFRDKFSGALLGSRVINRIASERVEDVYLNVESLKGGKTTVGTVALDQTAISAVTVELQSSNPAVASVPATATVSTNGYQKTFNIVTTPVLTDRTVTIRARRKGVETSWRETTFVVEAPRVSYFSPRLVSMYPGNSAILTARLDGAAPRGFTVAMASANSRLVSVPATVAFSAGATSASFRVGAGPSSVARSVAVIAKYGSTESARAVVNLLVPEVASITLSPSRVTGGATVSGTVKLANTARPGGALVTLTGYVSGVVSGPVSLTIPEGSNTGTFTLQTANIRTARRLAIKARTSSVVKSATLIVDRT